MKQMEANKMPQTPKGETAWVGYYSIDHDLKYIITSKAARDSYFLYEVIDDAFVKIAKDKSPAVLEEKYIDPAKLGVVPEPKAKRRKGKQ